MNIPKLIKIGGITYAVEITDKLNLGSIYYTGEIDCVNLVIRVCSHALQKQEVDLLHELLYGIVNHLGYTDHDEKKINELAHALYMVIQDNPELFALKVESKPVDSNPTTENIQS